MKTIKLTKGQFVIVDDEDFEHLNQWKWFAFKDHNSFYAHRRDGNSIVRMHRFLLSPKKDEVVDHINRNGLDNRRENLRLCSHSENVRNSAKHIKSTSKFKGVYLPSGRDKWRAVIRINGKKKSLGTFASELEAAIAYNNAALKYFGKFAYLNPLDPYLMCDEDAFTEIKNRKVEQTISPDESKNCVICGKLFFRRNVEGPKRWKERKYCNQFCSKKGLSLNARNKDSWPCAFCKRELNLQDFYPRKDGRPHSYCKECVTVRERIRTSTYKRDWRKFYNKDKPQPYTEKVKARHKLRQAVLKGIILRKSCEVCGEKANAHHEDYSKPLEVKWLCRKHHGIEHWKKLSTPTEKLSYEILGIKK